MCAPHSRRRAFHPERWEVSAHERNFHDGIRKRARRRECGCTHVRSTVRRRLVSIKSAASARISARLKWWTIREFEEFCRRTPRRRCQSLGKAGGARKPRSCRTANSERPTTNNERLNNDSNSGMDSRGVVFIDQTKLPTEETYVTCTTHEQVAM